MWNQGATDINNDNTALGLTPDSSLVNKFSYLLNASAAGGEQLISSFGGSFNPTTDVMKTAQTFTISYNNGTDGLGQTGATILLITYIDENYNEVSAIHTLGNTGTDVTSFTGLGINRALVFSNGGLGWNANDITFTATTDSTTQAQIPATDSVTQQAIYHTAISYNLLTNWLEINVAKLAGGQAPNITVKGYSWSRVTQTRYEIFRKDVKTSVSTDLEVQPQQPFPIGGREVIYFVIDTDRDATNINLRFSGKLKKSQPQS